MRYHISNNALYRGKYYVGVVRYIDYKDNGRHGYSIGMVKNQSMLKEFHDEAYRLFPNAENPYIAYLDAIS